MQKKSLFKILALVSLHTSMSGFVLLNSKKSTLPATLQNPTITFIWDGKTPSISKKNNFRSGTYANLSDKEFMSALLKEAMSIWNNVPGSYLRLDISEGNASLNGNDKQHSIVIESSNNASMAAYAVPKTEENSSTIIDCDISIADRSTEASELAYTIAHELGHCIGLGHSHTNYSAMMGYSRASRQLTLGGDDIAGLIYLYPDPALVNGSPEEILAACATIQGYDLKAHTFWLLALLLATPLLWSLMRMTLQQVKRS